MNKTIPLLILLCAQLMGKETKKEHQQPKDETRINIYKDLSIVENRKIITATKNEFSLTGIPLQAFNDSIHTVFESKEQHVLNHITNSSNTEKTLTFFTKNPFENVPATLTYATEGLTWQPFYTADISPDSTMLNLNCWLTIKNNTNVPFNHTHFNLHDGKSGLNLVKLDNVPFQSNDITFALESPVSIPPQNETCVGWVLRKNIPTTKDFQLSMGGIFLSDLTNKEEKPKIETWLKCENTFKPLPEGHLTLYKQDQNFSKYPLHSFNLKRTELGEQISLKMPDNYENALKKSLEVNFKQTEFQKFTTHLSETANSLTLQNLSAEPIQIRVIIDFPSKGMVLKESQPSQKQGTEWLSSCAWTIQIPAHEKIDLKYRLRFHAD